VSILCGLFVFQMGLIRGTISGVDGSRQIVTALIDPTGTGNNFQAASVSTNGDNNPTNVGSQPSKQIHILIISSFLTFEIL
jgi:hypothetical protein